jgi:hypothetical protein
MLGKDDLREPWRRGYRLLQSLPQDPGVPLRSGAGRGASAVKLDGRLFTSGSALGWLLRGERVVDVEREFQGV